MLHTAFGIILGSELTSKDKETCLPFLTNLSDTILYRISEALIECQGNVLIMNFPKVLSGVYAGKKYEIPLLENYDKIYSHIIENIGSTGREVIVQDEMPEEWTLDSYLQLREFIESNNVEIVITDDLTAAKLVGIFLELYPDKAFHLYSDQPINDDRKFNLSGWDSWRAYCREMQLSDEFPLTFAGVRSGFFAEMDGQSRPRNTCWHWTNKQEVPVSP